MERRDFLRIAFGVAAGAVVTTAARAMTPAPSALPKQPPIPETEAKPAVATSQDVEEAKVENVHWRRRRWRHRHWRRRHWGWHRRRHWRHRHWRRRYYY